MPEKVIYEGVHLLPTGTTDLFLVDVPEYDSLFLISKVWISNESEIRNAGEIGRLVLENVALLSKEERLQRRIARINEVIKDATATIHTAKNTFDQYATRLKRYKSFLPPVSVEKEKDPTEIRFELIELG
jgi:hypothetical protein